jgi:hypothetical protein
MVWTCFDFSVCRHSLTLSERERCTAAPICSSRGLGASPLVAWWRQRAGKQRGQIVRQRDDSSVQPQHSLVWPQSVGRSGILVRPHVAASCAAARRADGWVPRPMVVYRFVCFVFLAFLLPFFSLHQAFSSFVGLWPVFFGELLCTGARPSKWPVLQSLGLYCLLLLGRVGAANTGVTPPGGGGSCRCPTGTYSYSMSRAHC